MMSDDVPFFKFPSTPHLLFAPEVLSRTDKLLPAEEKSILLSNVVTIEEKIDGANLGISFNSSGELLLQNRGQYLLPPYLGQWEKLPSWLNIFETDLLDILEDKLILFGEWCYARHSLHYTSLPNWFIGFDIYDIKIKKFYSVPRRNALINKMGLPIVPLIEYGNLSIADIPSLLKQSRYGECLSEGLYFRYDQHEWLNIRAKYVRSTFSQGIERHWSNSPFQKNQVVC